MALTKSIKGMDGLTRQSAYIRIASISIQCDLDQDKGFVYFDTYSSKAQIELGSYPFIPNRSEVMELTIAKEGNEKLEIIQTKIDELKQAIYEYDMEVNHTNASEV